MAPFKVIIVGGSIAGLALANMLEQYDIDFVVLEKHALVAPQLGAGFAIQPNGARILDQLGCYQALEDANEPVNSLLMSDRYGGPAVDLAEFGRWFQESFGSKMRFMDRRKVIETLFENLRDRSKVKTSHGVVKVFYHSEGVEVETAGGSLFHGDLVVGADGVHSRVRQEMQRIAAENSPGTDLFPEAHAFTCDYGGLFGISKAPEGLRPDQAFKRFGEGHNHLCAAGPDNTLYWFLPFKNEEKTQGKAIPRYTEDDLNRIVALARDDMVRPGLNFGDIYDRRIRVSIVPIEEGILKHSFYKRMVLLGDSWHKVNPLGGLGGNTAIQSAAVLANELKDTIVEDGNTNEAGLETALRNYQQARLSLSSKVVDMSHGIQKMEALETRVTKFIQLNLIKKAGMEVMADALSKMFAETPRLKHLPLPSRGGFMPFSDEVRVKPKRRSGIVTMLFALLLATFLFFLYPHMQQAAPTSTSEKRAKFVQLYYNLSVTVITVIISIESYRTCFSIGPLRSALPFGIAAMFVGWEFVAPLYMALFVFFTGIKSYYYPSPRAIDLATARSLQLACLVNYLPVIAYTFACSTFPSFQWALSHATLPLTIQLARKGVLWWEPTSCGGGGGGPALLWGDRDLKPISIFFSLLQLSLLLVSFFGDSTKGISMLRFIDLRSAFSSGNPCGGDDAKALLLDLMLMAFMWFIIWDIRRVNANSENLGSMMLFYTAMGLALAPSVAVARLWASRETEWEASRKRQSPIDAGPDEKA